MKYKKAASEGIGVLMGVILIVLIGFIVAMVVPAIAKQRNALCLYPGMAGCSLGGGEEKNQDNLEAPSGEGKASWERFEMRIHKRLIDLGIDERALRLVMRVPIPEDLNIEIEMIEN